MNEVAFDLSSAALSPPLRSGYCPEPASAGENLRECSICDQPKPAKEFRAVIGRITTEACGECCDLRDEISGISDPMGPAAIAAFCSRVAIKRFEKFQSTKIDGRPPVNLARSAAQRIAPSFSRDKAAPTFSGKEKSALAKDPKEYAAWLQKLPDRIAAIVAKTYAVIGDDAIKHGIPDDEALIDIMDLLNAGDDTLIARNRNKRLARKSS
jgi:hypothetical protein